MYKFTHFLLLVGCFQLFLFGDENPIKPKPKYIPVTTAQPEEHIVYPIAVIGAGAAGTMAAHRATLNNRKVLLFTGAKHELRNSRGMWVRKVENIPGLEKYSRTVVELRNEILTQITTGPFSENLFVIKDSVCSIEKQGDIFCLKDTLGKTYLVQYVVLATGMMDVQPHIQGSIKPILEYANKQHIAYCLLCDGHRSFGKKTAIIGYQEDAAKAALVLWDRYHPTALTILTNGNACEFSAEVRTQLEERHIAIVEEPIQDILGNKELNQFSGFQLETEQVACDIGFVLLGIRPNNNLARMLGLDLDERGLVLTDKDGKTRIPNVFVIGDLRANSIKQIYTAWQHAVDAITVIDRNIRAQNEDRAG
jgi:thioredoxin reductase (NADPH)